MTSRKGLLLTWAGLACLPLVGCTLGPIVWTAEVTEELQIETANLKGLDAQTHNGAITYHGQPDRSTATVLVTKKGGGHTLDDAEAALDAIDVVIEPSGDGTQRIAWRWSKPKQLSWGARVSYQIDAPAGLAFGGRTHNGPIEASGVAGGARIATHNGAVSVHACTGDVRLAAHNGPIEVESSGGSLHARSHNGRITADYEGDDVTLRTHNGRLKADVARCASLQGDITTHNGSITLTVGNDLSADLTCSTHNGSIRCDAPWQVREVSRHRAAGRLGQGGAPLTARTHNGSIRIVTHEEKR